MNYVRLITLVLSLFCADVFAQDGAPPPAQAAQQSEAAAQESAANSQQADQAAKQAERAANDAKAAAAVASGRVEPHTPDFLEYIVDEILQLFDIRSSGNTTTHYVIAAIILVAAFIFRRIVITGIFGIFRKLAARTRTNLDDKLFTSTESPLALLVFVLGAVAACKVLKLPPAADRGIAYGYTLALSFVVFWLLLRAFNTLLDHLHERARAKNMGIAAFMPWIKKTLLTVFVIFGVLMVAQSLGADVKAFLAGLGIGGLAVALAAQDTIANVFGSVVIAVDHPFKIGEFVQVGANSGAVEDIGLRSTRLRRADKALVVIPNKIVASEPVINLSRFTQRRVEQTIGLTYDAKPDQIESLVNEIRSFISEEPGVDKPSVIVQFTNFSASSLDIWIAYQTLDPDFVKHLQLKQRLNFKIMRAVEARGLSFAFPTQTVQLEGPVARQLAASKAPDSNGPMPEKSAGTASGTPV
jgi:MscS family membrane protein